MTTEVQQLEELQSCIEQLGKEFQKGSDYWFWKESDFRSRLLCLCLETVGQTLQYAGKVRARLTFPEIPTRANTASSYDLAVFRPEDATKIAEEAFTVPDQGRFERKLTASLIA